MIGGMKQTLSHARNLTLLMELWPQGLRNMGADPKQLLLDLEQMQLQLYELGESGVPVRINSKDDLISKYQGRKYTNIVAIRNTAV